MRIVSFLLAGYHRINSLFARPGSSYDVFVKGRDRTPEPAATSADDNKTVKRITKTHPSHAAMQAALEQPIIHGTEVRT